MADFVLTLGVLVAVIWVTLLGLRRLRVPRSAWAVVAHCAFATALGLMVVAVPTYYVTKSRSFQLAGQLVSRVDADEKVIALTFDDGPTQEYAQDVLAILDAEGAAATFYLTGKECEKSPEALRAIVAAGHELGNHTLTHRRMYFLSGASVAREVERTDDIFRDAGYDGPITFRPPGCKRLLTTPLYLAANGRITVTWDLEPDSLAGVADGPDGLVRYVVDNVRPGSIVLLHPMYETRGATREALPEILDELKSEGYRFVTVSELLALR